MTKIKEKFEIIFNQMQLYNIIKKKARTVKEFSGIKYSKIKKK